MLGRIDVSATESDFAARSVFLFDEIKTEERECILNEKCN